MALDSTAAAACPAGWPPPPLLRVGLAARVCVPRLCALRCAPLCGPAACCSFKSPHNRCKLWLLFARPLVLRGTALYHIKSTSALSNVKCKETHTPYTLHSNLQWCSTGRCAQVDPLLTPPLAAWLLRRQRFRNAAAAAAGLRAAAPALPPAAAPAAARAAGVAPRAG